MVYAGLSLAIIGIMVSIESWSLIVIDCLWGHVTTCKNALKKKYYWNTKHHKLYGV